MDTAKLEIARLRSDLAATEQLLEVHEATALEHSRKLEHALETSRQAERLKAEFVSTVSHELRTPLTSIGGSLSLIAGGLAGELPPQARSLIEVAQRNCVRLVALINDILDVEKLASGKMRVHVAPLELSAAVRRSLEDNQGYAERHEVALRAALPTADVTGLADSDRLQQVLANLISNACKFSPTGAEVLVSLEVQACGMARIEVRDQGPGIPAEFRGRVFQPFSQADGSTRRSTGGTGLGLNICKALMEQMGGAVGFDCPPEGGTVFHATLPLVAREPAPAALEDTGSGLRVLICEDDADAAVTIRRVLEGEGAQCQVAPTLGRARELIAAGGVDLLTLDMLLPDGDGIALIRELRAAPQTADLPVLVISARSREDVEEVGPLEILDWLEKPFDLGRLRSALAMLPAESLRILHVEDDADVLDVVGQALRDVADMIPARSLSAARAALEGPDTIDLVLLDLALPDGTGFDLLPAIRRRGTPVVVFSASELDGTLSAGFECALLKGRASPEELVEQVLAALSARRPVSASSS